jgi:hypothetical protein
MRRDGQSRPWRNKRRFRNKRRSAERNDGSGDRAEVPAGGWNRDSTWRLSYFLRSLSAGWGWIDEVSSNHRKPGMVICVLPTSKDGKTKEVEWRAFPGFRPRRMRVEDRQVGDRTMDHD